MTDHAATEAGDLRYPIGEFAETQFDDACRAECVDIISRDRPPGARRDDARQSAATLHLAQTPPRRSHPRAAKALRLVT